MVETNETRFILLPKKIKARSLRPEKRENGETYWVHVVEPQNCKKDEQPRHDYLGQHWAPNCFGHMILEFR